jgi:phage/plasmid primase-like uncharacterized protein
MAKSDVDGHGGLGGGRRERLRDGRKGRGTGTGIGWGEGDGLGRTGTWTQPVRRKSAESKVARPTGNASGRIHAVHGKSMAEAAGQDNRKAGAASR